jgi:hypothetical protein
MAPRNTRQYGDALQATRQIEIAALFAFIGRPLALILKNAFRALALRRLYLLHRPSLASMYCITGGKCKEVGKALLPIGSIAGSPDGAGASYYTFGDRGESELTRYVATAELAFCSIARICDRATLLVQMVAFSSPDWQLRAYLAMLERAGFRESLECVPNDDGNRMWRQVPNRKWYASWRKSIPSSSEVVLFHRLA